MPTAIWVIGPYAALLSFLVGTVWRRRRGRTRDSVALGQCDRVERSGRILLRFGVVFVIAGRVAEMFATRSHPGPVPAPLVGAEVVAVPIAVLGAALVLLPDVLGGSRQRAVTPVDRVTLPLLTFGVLSGILAEFDDSPTDTHNRLQDTLFVWLPAAFSAHPHPQAMVTAPVIVQIRALIVLTIGGIWPYTRLAGVVSEPLTNTARRIAQRAGIRRRAGRYATAIAREPVSKLRATASATRPANVN